MQQRIWNDLCYHLRSQVRLRGKDTRMRSMHYGNKQSYRASKRAHKLVRKDQRKLTKDSVRRWRHWFEHLKKKEKTERTSRLAQKVEIC